MSQSILSCIVVVSLVAATVDKIGMDTSIFNIIAVYEFLRELSRIINCGVTEMGSGTV